MTGKWENAEHKDEGKCRRKVKIMAGKSKNAEKKKKKEITA